MMGRVATGRIRRELAKTYKNRGLSNQAVADLLGVTAQHVSYMLNDTRRRRSQLLKNERARRSRNAKMYVCGVCGERGHNAQRHKNFSEEDVAWLRDHSSTNTTRQAA